MPSDMQAMQTALDRISRMAVARCIGASDRKRLLMQIREEASLALIAHDEAQDKAVYGHDPRDRTDGH